MTENAKTMLCATHDAEAIEPRQASVEALSCGRSVAECFLALVVSVVFLSSCRSEFVVDFDPGSSTLPTVSTEDPDTETTSHGTDDTTTATTTTSTTGTATATEDNSTTATTTDTTATDSTGTTTTSTDTTSIPDEFCEVPPKSPICDDGPDNVLRAMELGCADDPEGIADLTLTGHNGKANTYRVATYYGNANWVPRKGSAFIMLSTGFIPEATGDRLVSIPMGQVDDGDGDNPNSDGISGLTELTSQPGSQKGLGGKPFTGCDGIGDCSDSLSKNFTSGSELFDSQWIRFDMDVPAGVHSLSVDFAWFSAEFPRRLDTGDENHDDIFALWISGESYTGNFAVIEDALPVTPRFLGQKRLSELKKSQMADKLNSTGFAGEADMPCSAENTLFDPCPRGFATPQWWTATAPVRPGDTIKVAVLLADRVDSDFDTVVLLDNWRWGCESCTWYQDCGVHLADAAPTPFTP